MKECIDKKNEYDIIIDFKVTLKDLMENNIYKYEYSENDIFYVPMWFGSLEYKTKDNKKIIFNSQLVLPSNVSINTNNDININLRCNIQEIMQEDNIEIKIDNNTYRIAVSLLKIRKYQEVIYYKRGISIPNKIDIYNTKNKSNIIFHISLY